LALNSSPIRTLGPYHLLEQVGRGGMATVFKAFHPEQERYVAIKVMSPAMAGEGQFSKRFRREAEVVMRLKHPHIVPVESFGEQDGFVYLVMPLLKVGSLADRLGKGALTPSEGARIMAQISDALQFAHDQGVVHRDVKPSNILMDETGNALLSDFGLAQIHDASVSLTGSALLGTPAYMSPEQARGETVDARSDQYSLGVILYQLSTGRLPFEADTPMAVLMKHINEPLPPARMKSPNVPPAVERVILKATAKLPQERFASVGELNQAFQAALAHAQDPFSNPEPKIQVPPSSVSIQASHAELTRPKRRGRRLAAALALLLLLLLACPATSSGLQELLGRSASPAEGSPLSMADMNDPQLTALAGTIEAMSTELARAGGGTLSAEDIPTMVMETLVADATGGPTDEPTDASTILTPLGGPAFTGPTETPSPGPSPTPSLTPTKTKTPTPGPSPTPSNTPTKTLTPTLGPSPTPSHTPTDTPTATLGPSPTSTRTPTPTQTGMPSATFSPSASPSPSATTPVVPTTVSAPTDAPTVMVPTVPVLPSPTPDVCSQLDLGGFQWTDGSQEVSIKITNNSTVTVKIMGLRLDWPPPNVKLLKIEMDGRKIWNNGDGSPPTYVTTGDWTGSNSDRNIGPDSSKTLVFFFDANALPGPYSLDLWFDASSCHLFRGP
jgi:serine/threonine-protein kinase